MSYLTPLMLLLVYGTFLVFVVWAIARLVRAMERIASSLERIARRDDKP